MQKMSVHLSFGFKTKSFREGLPRLRCPGLWYRLQSPPGDPADRCNPHPGTLQRGDTLHHNAPSTYYTTTPYPSAQLPSTYHTTTLNHSNHSELERRLRVASADLSPPGGGSQPTAMVLLLLQCRAHSFVCLLRAATWSSRCELHTGRPRRKTRSCSSKVCLRWR